MFTGLIEELGTIESIIQIGKSRKIQIKASKIMSDISIDDSISIDGVCQTVIAYEQNYFIVEAVEETMEKTNFKLLRPNKVVNLERAAKFGGKIGGHIVQGHVDCTGKLISIEEQSLGYLLSIEFPYKYRKYIVEHGSVCINGISLTVARLNESTLTVAIIPHTWDMTNLKYNSIGTLLNLEFDLFAKYVENMMKYRDNTHSTLNKYIEQPNI